MKVRSSFAAALVCLLALAACGGHHSSTTTTHRAQPVPPKASCPGYQTAYGCQAHSPNFGIPSAPEPPALGPTGIQTLEMFDSVSVSALPLSAQAVAGYTSGNWPTFPLLLGRWPHVVSIAVNAAQIADHLGNPIRCLDVEPGDASPSQAGTWDLAIKRIGGRPCDYENASTLPAVEASIRAAGLRPGVDVDEFVADWTFRPHLYPGSACTQWTDHGPQGQNYDESTCTLAFLGIHPTPKPQPSVFSIFPTLKLHAPHGTWTERGLAESIDGALQHPVKFRAYLRNELEPDAAWMAARIAYLASNVWPKPHPDWSANHGGSRRMFLSKASNGKRIA